MDDPPGDFLVEPTSSFVVVVGSILASALFATILAATLAAARTALHFAGLLGREDMVWAAADSLAQNRARRWLKDARLLTVAIQLCHTVSRVVAVVGIFVVSLMLGSHAVFPAVIVPGVLCLVLTEAFARLFARKYPIRALSRLNTLIGWIHKAILPLTHWLDSVNRRWRFAFGERRSAEKALAQVIGLAAASETEGEKEVVQGIVNFSALRVRDVMKRGDQIRCISASSNFHEVVTFVNQCGYSRIPVFKGSVDSIEGVLYTKDLLPFFEQGKEFPWMNIIRPGYFVVPSKRIDALLKDFQEKRVHIAIVRDDAGKTVGLITLEDLIELVIRDINEQPDPLSDQGYTRIDDRTYIFDGKTSIREVFEMLDVEHPMLREATELESLEDFIVEINDELPREGDEVSYDQFTFVVEAVENKRIKRVRVNVHAQA